MTKSAADNIKTFLNNHNIYPQNLEPYLKAFTHKSLNPNPDMNYETLELLGDVVIKLVITSKLLSLYPAASEGDLAKQRSILIQDKLLAQISQEIGLGALLICGENEKTNKISEKNSILADLLESLIGALYLEQGLAVTEIFTLYLFENIITNKSRLKEHADNKTQLQELTQSLGAGLPDYTIIKEEGPDHKKTYTVKASIQINNENISTISKNNTKKEAEQKAAKLLIQKISKIK